MLANSTLEFSALFGSLHLGQFFSALHQVEKTGLQTKWPLLKLLWGSFLEANISWASKAVLGNLVGSLKKIKSTFYRLDFELIEWQVTSYMQIL